MPRRGGGRELSPRQLRERGLVGPGEEETEADRVARDVEKEADEARNGAKKDEDKLDLVIGGVQGVEGVSVKKTAGGRFVRVEGKKGGVVEIPVSEFNKNVRQLRKGRLPEDFSKAEYIAIKEMSEEPEELPDWKTYEEQKTARKKWEAAQTALEKGRAERVTSRGPYGAATRGKRGEIGARPVVPTYEEGWGPEVETAFGVSPWEWEKRKALEEAKEKGLAEKTLKGEYRLTESPTAMTEKEQSIVEEAGFKVREGPGRQIYEAGFPGSEAVGMTVGSALKPYRGVIGLVPGKQPGEKQQPFGFWEGYKTRDIFERQPIIGRIGAGAGEIGVTVAEMAIGGEAVGITTKGVTQGVSAGLERAGVSLPSVGTSARGVLAAGEAVAPRATSAARTLSSGVSKLSPALIRAPIYAPQAVRSYGMAKKGKPGKGLMELARTVAGTEAFLSGVKSGYERTPTAGYKRESVVVGGTAGEGGPITAERGYWTFAGEPVSGAGGIGVTVEGGETLVEKGFGLGEKGTIPRTTMKTYGGYGSKQALIDAARAGDTRAQAILQGMVQRGEITVEITDVAVPTEAEVSEIQKMALERFDVAQAPQVATKTYLSPVGLISEQETLPKLKAEAEQFQVESIADVMQRTETKAVEDIGDLMEKSSLALKEAQRVGLRQGQRQGVLTQEQRLKQAQRAREALKEKQAPLVTPLLATEQATEVKAKQKPEQIVTPIVTPRAALETKAISETEGVEEVKPFLPEGGELLPEPLEKETPEPYETGKKKYWVPNIVARMVGTAGEKKRGEAPEEIVITEETAGKEVEEIFGETDEEVEDLFSGKGETAGGEVDWDLI